MLPPWKGQDNARGLKVWGSKTKRGNWRVPCICQRAVNMAGNTYLVTFAVPPVVQAKVNKDGDVVPDPDGYNMWKAFILTIRMAYCKYLDPEVEPGTLAYMRVLQYMMTKPVRLKLLRAVITCA